MTHDQLLALCGFSFVTTVTPGPNNLMLMASGANFGLRRTLPHMAGISLGMAIMLAAMGLGLAGVERAVPQIGLVLKVVATVYMLWLAWKIAHAAAPGEGKAGVAEARPMSTVGAAAFQWVNPKAWAMALTAVSVHLPQALPGGTLGPLALLILVFVAIGFPCITLWAAVGGGLRRWLADPRARMGFNYTMALLLVASLWPILKM